MKSQKDVTEFYDRLVFPSQTSHDEYRRLVPGELSGRRVGDFGCGRSLFRSELESRRCEVLYLDIAMGPLRALSSGKRIRASLTDLPIHDRAMDLVFCIGVLHHLPEMRPAVAELIRVIRPGGSVFLGVYAEGTVAARLRTLWDRLESTPIRWGIRGVTALAIWWKNRNNGLRFRSLEHRKRVADLLDTPIVRYLPLQEYLDLVQEAGGKMLGMTRISSMNVLEIGRVAAV